LQWATDGTSLAIATQNSDAAGTQLYGITVLAIPDFTPLDIYSTQAERVSDIAADGNKAAMVSLDMTTLSLIDLSADNSVLLTITPDYFIGNATFSPDSTMVAVSKMDVWEVVLYSTADGTEIRTLTGFETASPVYQAGFKESSQWMVWLARGTLQLQEIESGNLGPQMSHEDFVMAYALTNDGTIVASAASKTVNEVPVPAIILWDATQGMENLGTR
jgi:WD40 repeat protein